MAKSANTSAIWKCPYPGCHFTASSYSLLKKHFATHSINPCPVCGKRNQSTSSHFYFKRSDPAHLVFYCLLKRNYNNNALSGAERFKIAKEACCNA